MIIVELSSCCRRQHAVERCREYTPRVYEKLGHLRIDRITPREIDGFIAWLGKQHVEKTANAAFKGDLKAILSRKGMTQKSLAEQAGVSPQTIKSAAESKLIRWENAEKISAALGEPCKSSLISVQTIKCFLQRL